MRKNISIRLKSWTSAIAFCLLYYCSIVNIAYANTSDFEMAFATVSGKAGNSIKTAGCIIVWLTGKEIQNIYCRYELDKDKGFQRDNDKGINLDDVKLFTSADKIAFQAKIKEWFTYNKLTPTPTPTDLSYFADAMSRLFESKTHHFVLKDQLDIGTYRQFAAAVHDRLIKEKIPEKVTKEEISEKAIEEVTTVVTEIKVQEKAGAAAEKPTEQVKVEKIAANVATISTKPATGLELSIMYISIFLFYLLFIPLFIWLFLTSRKTTSQLKDSEMILEMKINDNVSTINQEIANLKTLHKILQEKTLPKHLEEMHKQLRSDLVSELEKITQLSPIKESQIENEFSSQDSHTYYRKEIERLEGEKRQLENRLRSERENAENILNNQLEIEREKFQNEFKGLEQEKQNLEEQRRSERDEYKNAENALKSQLTAEQEKVQKTEKSLVESQTEVEKLNHHNQQLETYLSNSKAEYEKESAQRQEIEQTLAKTKQEVETLSHAEKTLQNVLFKRFRLTKPKDIDFTIWTTALIDQKGSWFWLQPTLLGELLICELIFNQLKKQGNNREQDILKLLYFDNIIKHWRKIISQLFETNDKLWVSLRDIDSRQWLNQILRAGDILKTYFPEEKSFELLSQHLSNVNGILMAALLEMGVTKILAPKLLEAVPSYVPTKNDRNQIYTPTAILKVLVKDKVQSRLKEIPQFVVDIQRYGFCTADKPDASADVQVFVGSLAEWE